MQNNNGELLPGTFAHTNAHAYVWKTHLVLIVEILQVLQYKEYTICKDIYFSVKKNQFYIYARKLTHDPFCMTC